MKKRHIIGLTLMCLLAGAGVGMGIASFHSFDAPMMVYAEGEETSEPETETTTTEESEEEKSKIQEYIDLLEEKYEEIKNKQVLGTTVGAIVGALIGAVVSFVPAMMNRSNIKKSLEDLALGQRIVSDVHKELIDIQKTYNIQHEEFTEVIKVVGELSRELKTIQGVAQKALNDNKVLHEENAELKDILIQIASNNSELVSKGVAEAICTKYLNK